VVPETNVTAPEQLSFAGCAKEMLAVNNPNKIRSVVDRGYRKRFISSKGALVFQIMDCRQNKFNHLLITRALLLKKFRAFTNENRVVMLGYKLKVINILVA